MPHQSILEIADYGAWNGGMLVDNSIYEGKEAKLILNDSVGAGMTRSSFLQRIEPT